MKKWYAFALVVVIILGYGYFAANRGLNKPDNILIRELFLRGEHAVETKNVREAMSCISADYKGVFPRNRDGMRLAIAQAFRNQMTFDVQMDVPEIHVTGDQASAMTKVTLLNITGGSRDRIFSGNINFALKKEPARRYFIYPVKEWKVVSVEGLGQLGSELGG